MADLVPEAIVLGFGGAVVGGPEALRLLLAVAGDTAAAGVIICMFLFCAFTDLVLATLLVARFLRLVRNEAPPPPAPGAGRFVRVALGVALVVVAFVTACQLVMSTSRAG